MGPARRRRDRSIPVAFLGRPRLASRVAKANSGATMIMKTDRISDYDVHAHTLWFQWFVRLAIDRKLGAIRKTPPSLLLVIGPTLTRLLLERLCLVLEAELVRLSVGALLVHNGDALQARKEVLVLPVDAASVSAAEIVQVRDLVEQEVDQSNDDCDTEGEEPDSDDSNDVGL